MKFLSSFGAVALGIGLNLAIGAAGHASCSKATAWS
jgi:hypothetical protein